MLTPAADAVSRIPLYVVAAYLVLLLILGTLVGRLFRGTSSDFFVAERSIGPVLLLMSVFGTTMTAFALVGSTGEAWERGAGVYGLMASASGIVHSLVFFLVGIKLWAIGKRHGFMTQVEYFRARYRSTRIGYLLFPILVVLVVPYLLIGILGAGVSLRGVTVGMFPETFPGQLNAVTGKLMFVGAVPPWLTGLVVCAVVLYYIFTGGLRSAAWANAFQTLVFMITGVVAFLLISNELGGLNAATDAVLQRSPQHLTRAGMGIGKLEFLSYMFVPLSVGMFPHLFQHWLTAKRASSFKLTTIAHPLFIGIVWVPCILIGIWAAGAGVIPPGNNPNALLPKMVDQYLHNPYLTGLLIAGILAAIMSSLDSQFVCLGTMFTRDIVVASLGKDRFTDRQLLSFGRGFIVAIVAVTYVISLFPPPKIFDLAVWCFSGFSGLFPLVLASVYWRRATKAGAYASILAAVATWGWFFWNGLVQPTLAGEVVHGEPLIGGMMPVAFVVAASAAAMVVVSLLTSPPPEEHVERFMVSTRDIG
ncbi:MAG: sodium:solute symporter family protein [Planctomycetota bacterium]